MTDEVHLVRVNVDFEILVFGEEETSKQVVLE
jgi:hypothetical protein